MTMARASTSGRRTSTIPRTGDGSKCRGGPVKSKTQPAMVAKTTRSTAKCQAGSKEGGSKASGRPGVALLAPSRPLVGRPPSRPDSEPAVAAETPPAPAVAQRIREPSTPPSDRGGPCVAGREACSWSVVSSVRSRRTAARSPRVRPPLSSLRISSRMNRMTRARSCGEADASKARRRAMLARTWRPDSILSSRLS
jgi:hypothetical protein